MKTYKWQLINGSLKIYCPKCGRKTFVPYVLASDNRTQAGANFGRCERINSCGYSCYPTGVEKYEITHGNEQKKELEPFSFDSSIVKSSYKSKLFDYCCLFFDKSIVENAFDKYKIGALKDGATIFWQIDISGVARAAKCIYYGDDGHRIKDESKPHAIWLHKMQQLKKYMHGEALKQCFFGEHLLFNIDKEKTPIAIVEAEKTALLMSMVKPGAVWLAVGGAQNLNNVFSRLSLHDYNVTLYNDNGCWALWHRIAQKYGHKINDFADSHRVFDGCDVWDVFENEFLTKIKEL